MSEEGCADVRLVVEEAVSNTIRHGYADQDPHEIRLRVAVESGELSLEIEDDARAYNPLEAPLPDLSVPIEERSTGGMGLTLLRALMDRAEYRRSGGKNVLRLVKRL
jgi:anti-sigma regulatory factor (Ser/Thr protein kinase)